MHSTELTPRGLQGVKRRVVYLGLYETIAIAVVTLGLAAFTGQGGAHAGVIAIVASGIAIVWNLGFNWAFERWEARQVVKGRSVVRRIAHAVCFETGLIVTLVPLFAWWFQVGLWDAFVMDLGLALFFLGYTFVFNWGFDHVFGLPASAQEAVGKQSLSPGCAAEARDERENAMAAPGFRKPVNGR